MQKGLPESSGGELIQLILPCTSGISQPVSQSLRKEHLYSRIDDDISERYIYVERERERAK